MRAYTDEEETLIDKIRALPPDKVAEIEDFVDFLRQRADDRALVEASMSLSGDAFRDVWDNPEDAVYDDL